MKTLLPWLHRNMSMCYEVDIETDAPDTAAIDVNVAREGVRR